MRKPHPRRDEIMERLSQPDAPSVAVMAEETGIQATTIYGWKQSSRRSGLFGLGRALGAPGECKERAFRTPSEKQKMVHADHLRGEALAAFLRQNGVTVAEWRTWKNLMARRPLCLPSLRDNITKVVISSASKLSRKQSGKFLHLANAPLHNQP